jgi:hypothetical protein
MALLASVMKGGALYIVFASGIDVFQRKPLQLNGLVEAWLHTAPL